MRHVIIIMGPTASGKSARALALACESNGIVINADAMQCYRPLPILSAQPTVEEQAQVPHQLYGLLAPDDMMTAARWRELALVEIERAFAAGQQPILCGGTGFYIKALLEGLAEIPAIDLAMRENLNAQQAAVGNAILYAELAQCDADSAARIKVGDTQRLLRALEVYHGTGQSLTWWQTQGKSAAPDWTHEIITIMPPRDDLYTRINQRTHDMLANHVLDEVAVVEIAETSPAWKTHGYREFKAYLAGRLSLDEAIAQTQQVTRNYAKRQMTWLRNQIKS